MSRWERGLFLCPATWQLGLFHRVIFAEDETEQEGEAMRNITRLASAAGIIALLMMPGAAAFGSEDGRNITLGAGAGAVAGGVLGHGDVGSIVGGAVVGGVAGHLLTPQKKRETDNENRLYSDSRRRYERDAQHRRDSDYYDREGNYIGPR